MTIPSYKTHGSTRKLLRGLSLAILAGCSALAHSGPENIETSTISRTEFNAGAGLSDKCCEPGEALQMNRAGALDRNVKFTLDTLFSAQAGSWTFESLVHNGLLRIASGYQPSHPRAITIHGGNSSLAGLARSLADPRKLERSGKDADGRTVYTLHYPLIIEKAGALTITDAVLQLDAASGTAIINAGALSVENASITTLQPDRKGRLKFRPFILAWNGSSTLIRNSRLSRLGYNAYLSGGVTLGDHAELKTRGRAKLQLIDSVFDAVETPVTAVNASVNLIDTTLTGSSRYAIDVAGSALQVTGSRIEGTRYNAGIRIVNGGRTAIESSAISDTHRSGIKVEGSIESFALQKSELSRTGSSSVSFERVVPQHGSLLISGNRITASGRSGIDASLSGPLLLDGNRIASSQRYALRAVFSDNTGGPAVWLHDNLFVGNARASISTSGAADLFFADNTFRSMQMMQPVLRGSLTSSQTALLRHSATSGTANGNALRIRQTSSPQLQISTATD